MIYRKMFWGFYKEKNIAVSDSVYFSAVDYYEDMAYIYIESESDEDVKQYVTGDFYEFPNGEKLAEMSMIFAYSPSDDEAVWRRTKKGKSEFSIAKLKHECVAEYVFYHYKMQAEGCGSYDKYGSIFLYGNTLIMYLEIPAIPGERWKRILPKNNLPDYSGDIISDCGIPHSNGEYWKKLQCDTK